MCLGPGLQTPGSEPCCRGAGDEFLGSLKLSFCICNIGMVLYPGGLEWDSDLARWSSGQVTPSFYSPGLPCMRKHPGKVLLLQKLEFILERGREGSVKQEDHSGTGTMGLMEDGPCPHRILGGPTRLCPQLCPSPAPWYPMALPSRKKQVCWTISCFRPLESWKRHRLKPNPCCVALAQVT